MKKASTITLAVMLLAGVAVGTTAAPRITPFKIVVTFSGSSATMRCLEGCMWQTTSFSCGEEDKECRFVLDQAGVGGSQRAIGSGRMPSNNALERTRERQSAGIIRNSAARLYAANPHARAENLGQRRVIDEFGEDYFCPKAIVRYRNRYDGQRGKLPNYRLQRTAYR